MDYNVDNIESKGEINPTMETDIILHKDGKFERAKIFGFNGKIKPAFVESVINEITNTYSVDPEQIVPSEATYQDETLAGDIIKRVDKNTGTDVNYRETTVWHDGTAMTDVKADGVIYVKKGVKYYKKTDTIELNVKSFGAKGDGVTDDYNAFQSAINALGSKGGLIKVPEGKYIISGTIILKKNIAIEGVVPMNVETHNAGVNHNSVIIQHAPTVADTDLFIANTLQAFGYISSITLKNMSLIGSANSRTAVHIPKASNLLIESVVMTDFKNGMICDTFLSSVITRCDIKKMSIAGLIFTGGVSTTTTFQSCYIHDMVTGTPLIIEKEKVLGVFFNECIFESTKYGLDIAVGNTVTFNSFYAENVPNDASGRAILNLGINGTDEANWAKGVCNINGGAIMGSNSTIHADSSVVNVDRWAALSITGVKFGRAGNSMKTTIKSGMIVVEGIYSEQISNDIFPFNVNVIAHINGATKRSNNVAGNLYFRHYDTNSRYKAEVSDVYGTGYCDLIFESNKRAAKLDYNGNVQVGGANVKSTDISECIIVGETGVEGTQNIGFTNAHYAKRIENVTLPHVKLSNNTKLIFQLNYNGTTASRPTGGRYAGMQYFDSTLGRPIWWNGSAWVDTTPDATTAAKGVVKQAVADPNSAATDIAGLVADFNDLLAKLRTAGIIAP